MAEMVPEQIEHEVFIDAPPERVWQLITEAEHIKEWFAFDGVTIDLRPGGEFVMSWKEHGTFYSRIERVEPPHVFSYRGSIHPDQAPAEGNTTLVEFTISPKGNGTRLRVVESGFRDLALSEAERADFAAGNVQGWNGAFTALQEYLQRLATVTR
jgi:uncharacterized protein YndB with AHSA1/START domain